MMVRGLVALARTLGCWLALAVLTGVAAGAQPAPGLAAAAGASDRRPLSIGFLPEGSDFINAPILVERLRRDLLARPPVVAALVEAGFGPELELSPCDGPRDMVQRMNLSEFDLVLATAVVYARQQGDYGEPILMTHRPGDFKLPREAGVLRRGVVIAGRASPLFGQSKADPATLHAALAGAPLAVPSSDSAAGYIYPTLKLAQDYGLSRPGQYWFGGADAEVVKNVVAGMAPLGACREGELEALLPGAAEGRYCRILFRTDQFPTDPIVLRAELVPERSALGRELKVALKDFFKRSPDVPRDLSVENAAARAYEKLRRDLRIFDELNRRPETATQPALKPRLQTEPTTASAVMPATTPAVRPVLPGSLRPAGPAASPGQGRPSS
jgi:ABC-type phosphate/phosphonate transport system substrate-binding protein